jgi:L-alanine-DL-glutamate epimerase-like enolase superfamily enzyme
VKVKKPSEMSTIESIQLFKIPQRWLFLKITTSDGIEGWDEPIIEGKADTVAAAVRDWALKLMKRRLKRPLRKGMTGIIQSGVTMMDQ